MLNFTQLRSYFAGDSKYLKFYAWLVIPLIVIVLLIWWDVSRAEKADAISVVGGGDVYHSTDDGYSPHIVITCKWSGITNTAVPGYQYYVPEYHSSEEYCGEDTDGIYIRAGEELWCWVYGPGEYRNATKFMDATGWHKIGDDWSRDCTLRVD